MFSKLMTDFKRDQQVYQLAGDMNSSILGTYYFLFRESRIASGKDQTLIQKFDENGIPINATYIDVKDQDYVYFPISIGQLGLAVYHTFLESQSDTDRNRFLKFVDWFYDHAEEDPTLGVRWMTHVPLPQYRNPGPWQSAFSQSRSISILLRGFQLTGDQKYADMAEAALVPFTRQVSEGGVTSLTPWGPFYEEYPAKVPTLVLNGLIFSLCGVKDFVRVFPKHKQAGEIFENGVKTLKNILPEFDMGYWSRYNLCMAGWYPDPDPATIGYQRLHGTQLEMMFKLTEDPVFADYAKRFRKQDNPLSWMRMFGLKYRALSQLKRI
ncbi:hypothetical protein HQ585_03380 [candidate division KSB1 bacterium]|nr:hypothetical protein [candidate division KSB1 bacterium]